MEDREEAIFNICGWSVAFQDSFSLVTLSKRGPFPPENLAYHYLMNKHNILDFSLMSTVRILNKLIYESYLAMFKNS